MGCFTLNIFNANLPSNIFKHQEFDSMKIAAVLFSFLTTFQILGHGFGPDTYIKVFSNGSEGWQAISQIHASKKKYLQVKTYDANLVNPSYDKIKFSGQSKTNCYFEIDFGKGQHNVIRCTPSQSFYLPAQGKWLQSCELTSGDYLFRDDSDGNGSTIEIKSIRFVNAPLDIYTLEVNHTHTFLVGFDSVLTHNISLLLSLSMAFGEGAVAGGELGSYCGPITAGIGLGVGGLIGVGFAYYKYKRHGKIKYDVQFNPNEVQRVFRNGLERSRSKKKFSVGGGSNKEPNEDDDKKKENSSRLDHFSKQSKQELLKSKSSHEKLVHEHKTKLDKYIESPDTYDNKGILKNVSSNVRDKIISGRVRELKRQIARQLTDLDIINDLIKSL